jgi:uncharacterized protein (TIGR03083 family)
MTLLGHDRYCDELLAQADGFRSLLRDADPAEPVPTCPGWSVADLQRHVGRVLLTLGVAVRTGKTVVPEPVPPEASLLDDWVAAAVEGCARALREAGPDDRAQVGGFTQSTLGWARRATHDMVIHRADAAAAVGADYTVDPEIAADAIDELLDLAPAIGLTARLGEPHGPEGVTGGTIHLHATDAPAGLEAEWLIELHDAGFVWRRDHVKADVAVRGPLTDVLRVFYRRLPADSPHLEVLGDTALLNFWLERISLG